MTMPCHVLISGVRNTQPCPSAAPGPGPGPDPCMGACTWLTRALHGGVYLAQVALWGLFATGERTSVKCPPRLSHPVPITYPACPSESYGSALRAALMSSCNACNASHPSSGHAPLHPGFASLWWIAVLPQCRMEGCVVSTCGRTGLCIKACHAPAMTQPQSIKV